MKKPTLFVILAFAGLAAGGAFYFQARQPEDLALVLSGNVDIREVTLSFRVPGRVAEVAVDEGARVEAGAVIARVDPAPLKASLDQARGSLAAAKANLALLQAGSRAEDIARLKAQTEGARAAVVNAQSTFERQQVLTTSRTSPPQVLDNARAALDQAKAEQEAAEQAYLAAQRGARPEEIAQAQAQVETASAQQKAAEIQLDDATLYAPSSGTVLTRAVEPGAMVAAGTGVATLSIDHPTRIRAYVQEPDLGRLEAGTNVLVYTDARPGNPYAGTVGFVSPRAEFTPKQVETQDLRTALVYRLRITVDDAENVLRQGMPVTVHLADEAR